MTFHGMSVAGDAFKSSVNTSTAATTFSQLAREQNPRSGTPKALTFVQGKLPTSRATRVTLQGGHTVVGAIVEVLRSTGGPMTAEEITEAIRKKHLYNFKAAEPAHIVRTQIRRRTEGLSMRAAAETKRFALTTDGRYDLIDKGQGSRG
jgi:hypothetical protein